jgi:hypothetical protein
MIGQILTQAPDKKSSGFLLSQPLFVGFYILTAMSEMFGFDVKESIEMNLTFFGMLLFTVYLCLSVGATYYDVKGKKAFMRGFKTGFFAFGALAYAFYFMNEMMPISGIPHIVTLVIYFAMITVAMKNKK